MYLRNPQNCGTYDRVLLDAPCSSDRHVLSPKNANRKSDLMNWKYKNVLKTAKLQKDLLVGALHMLRVDYGRLVYATCALSWEENDAVVESAVTTWESTRNGNLRVVSPDEYGDYSMLNSIGERTEYGILVLPDSLHQWGPLYVAVLERIPL
eukprot:CAMPEP_0182441806 /NCGR_PEP_ID=MMETSP1172-20130603/809_1 /TAXON_ID=708627 /ORGANISM="Timspurckia oligopyrenoides, Strain CCMP3278" /LENGTH=151 /DNA_ID=CAMNT_0024636357 /DNA_START=706 /DNA_END=1161 /DNA_ORIENTATION=+